MSFISGSCGQVSGQQRWFDGNRPAASRPVVADGTLNQSPQGAKGTDHTWPRKPRLPASGSSPTSKLPDLGSTYMPMAKWKPTRPPNGVFGSAWRRHDSEQNSSAAGLTPS